MEMGIKALPEWQYLLCKNSETFTDCQKSPGHEKCGQDNNVE